MKRTLLAAASILVLVLSLMTAFAQGRRGPILGRRGDQGRRAEKVEKARDPVCGILVDKNPSLSAGYRGQVYYFCSRADMEKFKKEPERYASKKR